MESRAYVIGLGKGHGCHPESDEVRENMDLQVLSGCFLQLTALEANLEWQLDLIESPCA